MGLADTLVCLRRPPRQRPPHQLPDQQRAGCNGRKDRRVHQGIPDGVRLGSKLDHQNIPDPIEDRCVDIEKQIVVLQQEIAQLQKER